MSQPDGSPRSRDREAQCQNKLTFETRGAAKLYAREEKLRLTPYGCELCGLVHLSGMNKRQARARGYGR